MDPIIIFIDGSARRCRRGISGSGSGSSRSGMAHIIFIIDTLARLSSSTDHTISIRNGLARRSSNSNSSSRCCWCCGTNL